jgi:hypothetical protein
MPRRRASCLGEFGRMASSTVFSASISRISSSRFCLLVKTNLHCTPSLYCLHASCSTSVPRRKFNSHNILLLFDISCDSSRQASRRRFTSHPSGNRFNGLVKKIHSTFPLVGFPGATRNWASQVRVRLDALRLPF